MSRRTYFIAGGLVLLLAAVLATVMAVRGHGSPFVVRVADYDPRARTGSVVISNCTDTMLTYAWWLVDPNGQGTGDGLKPHEARQFAFAISDGQTKIHIEGWPQPERPRIILRLYLVLELLGIDTTTMFSVQVSLTNRAGWILPLKVRPSDQYRERVAH